MNRSILLQTRRSTWCRTRRRHTSRRSNTMQTNWPWTSRRDNTMQISWPWTSCRNNTTQISWLWASHRSNAIQISWPLTPTRRSCGDHAVDRQVRTPRNERKPHRSAWMRHAIPLRNGWSVFTHISGGRNGKNLGNGGIRPPTTTRTTRGICITTWSGSVE